MRRLLKEGIPQETKATNENMEGFLEEVTFALSLEGKGLSRQGKRESHE